MLGPFYTRTDDDLETVAPLPERHTAADIAEKIVHDIEHWYETDASVCRIADFDGLPHAVHGQGAVISWVVEEARIGVLAVTAGRVGVADTIRCPFPGRRRRFPYEREFAGTERTLRVREGQ